MGTFNHLIMQPLQTMVRIFLLLIVLAFSISSSHSQTFFKKDHSSIIFASDNQTPTSIYLTDLDGDGDEDILSSFPEKNQIAWFEHIDAEGNYAPQQTIDSSGNQPQAVFSADLNGDGYSDVLSLSKGDNTVAWYENTDGKGAFGPKQIIATSVSGGQNLSASDLDGDGDQDLMVSYANHMAWYENTDGKGTFEKKQVLEVKGTNDSLKTWRRYGFPGARHRKSPDFPPYQGSARSEWMHFFKVSPVDPTFMMTGFDMSAAFVAMDGREFQPVDMPLHRLALNVRFSTHHGPTAYLLYGHPCGSVGYCYPTETAIPGIWRTRDKGQSWEQIYTMPDNTPKYKGPAGKNQIAEDPHSDRRDHIYFGSHHRGLVRSIDDGDTWDVVAFAGRPIKTLSVAKGPDNTTLMYVIVGKPGEYGSRSIVPKGKLWRVEVAPQQPYEVSTIELSNEENYVDVAVSPDDWSRGMVIKDYQDGTRGGNTLAQFKSGGTLLASSRTSSQGNVDWFIDVHINPQDADHIVVRNQSRGMTTALQYSMDGGVTWNEPYPLDNGHMPSMVNYNPGHHSAPEGAMRNAFHQGQGPAVGFDARDPGVVYWWTQNFDKTPLKSRDYGATWKPFAYGGPYKEAAQIAIGPESKHMGVARTECGFLTTRDSGLSWISSTYLNDPVLRSISENAGFASQSKDGRGLAIKPDDPNLLVSLFGDPSSVLISRDGGLSWEDSDADAGGEHSVYWSRANTSVVYAGNQRSLDAGDTWSAMDRYVLAISSANENVLVGNQSVGDPRLSLSLDGGETWKDLPPVPEEHYPGTDISKPPISPQMATGVQTVHAVDIDPGSEHNPEAQNGEGIRILAAGRSGVYEYTADPADAFNGDWRVLNTGFEPSIHFSYIEEVPWIGHVVFDPRPGMEHVVYACKSVDPEMCRPWRPGNPNLVNTNGQARRPLYRSLDGGLTWKNLHAPEYTGIPDHLDVTAIEVGPDGTLYVDGYCGIYALPGVSQ